MKYYCFSMEDYNQRIKVNYPQDPIIDSVLTKFIRRADKGMIKYGMSLRDNTLTRKEWLLHAQEEAMDFVNYIEKLIQDCEN